MSRVVNIKLGEPYDVYIGRPGHGQAGPFGNPYPVKQTCSRCGSRHISGGSTLTCFREYLVERMAREPRFRDAILALRGKTLVCFCAPRGGLTSTHRPWRCHGQVILAILEESDGN